MARYNCIRCGVPDGTGEPPVCRACFDHFWRHDPASGGAYCGGCDDCETVHAERRRLQDEYHALGARLL